MISSGRRTRLAHAGQWLRTARTKAGYTRQVDFATALGVDKSLVSNYERGVSAIDDDRAAQIADLLGLDEIEARHQLGLWVPTDGVPEDRDLEHVRTEDLIRWGLAIASRYPDDPAIQQSAHLLITLAEACAKRSKKIG